MKGLCADCHAPIEIAEEALRRAEVCNAKLAARGEATLHAGEIACCAGCYLLRRERQREASMRELVAEWQLRRAVKLEQEGEFDD